MGKFFQHLKAGDGVNTLILSTDGNYCLNGGADGRVELRDAWTLDLLHTFPKCDTGTWVKIFHFFQKYFIFFRFFSKNIFFQKIFVFFRNFGLKKFNPRKAINFLALTHDQQTLIAAMKSGSVVAFKIDFTKWHPSKRGIFKGK